MSVYLAYVLGILTVLVIIILFYVFSRINRNVDAAYKNVFCRGPTSGGSPPSGNSGT